MAKMEVLEVQGNISMYLKRLALLTGIPFASIHDDLRRPQALPSLPVSIGVGDVSSLLRRRQDIVAAEYNLAIMTENYNVSVAKQFPEVSLNGYLGFIASSFSGVGADALVASVGPKISWAIFDLGPIKAEIAQNDARVHYALLRYEKKVLSALEELKTAVSAFSRQEQKRGQLQNAYHASQSIFNFKQKRFEAGIISRGKILMAEVQYLEDKAMLVNSDVETYVKLIAVYKSLGGGWPVKKK